MLLGQLTHSVYVDECVGLDPEEISQFYGLDNMDAGNSNHTSASQDDPENAASQSNAWSPGDLDFEDRELSNADDELDYLDAENDDFPVFPVDSTSTMFNVCGWTPINPGPCLSMPFSPPGSTHGISWNVL